MPSSNDDTVARAAPGRVTVINLHAAQSEDELQLQSELQHLLSAGPQPQSGTFSESELQSPTPPRDGPISSAHRNLSFNTLPFRQDVLWASLVLSFFAFLSACLLAFTLSARFQRFVVVHANALFTIPYVISFIVILACLAPWVPSSVASTSLGQMNAGVIASTADFFLVLLVLIEWATCLALMLITLVAVHEGLTYISPGGLILPRPDSDAPVDQPIAYPAVAGIPRNSSIVLAVPLLTLYALFNCLVHSASCMEALHRRRRFRLTSA